MIGEKNFNQPQSPSNIEKIYSIYPVIIFEESILTENLNFTGSALINNNRKYPVYQYGYDKSYADY